jgi:hypothetical protein
MEQPDIVIGITDGKTELLHNSINADYLILDFDLLDEYGTEQERDQVEQLMKQQLFNEVSEYLADLEEELAQRMREEA